MARKVNAWLRQHGESFKDAFGWYDDCNMIDSCMHDLSLAESDRDAVGELIDAWILNH